jgi:fluoroquinolone resistance protein
VSFTQENYTGEVFSKVEMGDEEIQSVTFEECRFNECSFIATKLPGCRFVNCKFTDCTLSAIAVTNARFDNTSFEKCKAIGIDWTLAKEFRDMAFKNCQLNYSNFRFLKIAKTKMTGCEVKDADFTETDLSLSDLSNSDFEKTRFMKTNLNGANLKGATNYAIDARYCSLKKTRFSYPEVVTLLQNLDIIIE